MQAKTLDLTTQVMQKLENGHKKADVFDALITQGFDEHHLNGMIEECHKLLAAKKRRNGILLVLAGAGICFLSCVITLISGSASMSNVTLLGLTTIGVMVLFGGMTMLF